MPLEYKSVPFEVKELVDLAGGGWEIAGYASTFGGDPDAYGDVIVKGAFLDSLAKRSPKHLYEHFEPIGKTLEIHEDDKGLVGRWSIVDTVVGTDAYKLAKAGVLDSLSIGYIPVDYEYRADGVRLIRKIDLYEVSSVAVPANPNAVITDVKAPLSLSNGRAAEPSPPRLHLGLERLRRTLRRRGIVVGETPS